ncbi:MAG: hypothetical protein RLZZ89_464 [Cyanobacteriota bacterium]
MNELTHLNTAGEMHMVEVGDRPNSRRQATAEGYIQIGVEQLEQLEQVLSSNTKCN